MALSFLEEAHLAMENGTREPHSLPPLCLCVCECQGHVVYIIGGFETGFLSHPHQARSPGLSGADPVAVFYIVTFFILHLADCSPKQGGN